MPAGSRVYFQGTDNTLWVINSDGTGQRKVGNNKTKSSPFVIEGPPFGPDRVYFQGTDDTLWKVNSDGKEQHPVGKTKIASTPFVLEGGPFEADHVWFQSTDNKLWVASSDGVEGAVGNIMIKSSPFALSLRVYFRDTDNKLWRAKHDGKYSDRNGFPRRWLRPHQRTT